MLRCAALRSVKGAAAARASSRGVRLLAARPWSSPFYVAASFRGSSGGTGGRGSGGGSGGNCNFPPKHKGFVVASLGAMAAGTAAAAELPVEEAKVVVVAIPACPYCKRAADALEERGIPFVKLDVSPFPEVRQAIKAFTGAQTVPQIFVDGASVGGSDVLLPMLESGTFQQKVSEAQSPALPPPLLEALAQAQRKAQQAGPSTSGRTRQAPDSQLQALAQQLRDPASGVPTTPTQIGQQAYRTFTAGQLLAWLTSPQRGLSPDAARAKAQQLLESLLIAPAPLGKVPPSAAAASFTSTTSTPSAAAASTAEEVVYCITADAPKPLSGQALNTAVWWAGAARPAGEVAGELRQLILELYDKHLSKDGRAVSYKGIAADPLFARYVAATAELQKVDLTPLSPTERKALFINLYNALVVHALVVHGTSMTTAQRAVFYNRVAKYNIGGHDYTADDMENGVLRGNRAAASNLWNLIGLHGLAGPHFHGEDPRKQHVVPCDPRIHFALVCGAKSCPPIKLYTPDNLEEGLQAAAEAFCSSDVEVDVPNRRVSMSKIFKWYAIDFGSNKRERVAFVLPFLTQAQRSALEGLLAQGDVQVVAKAYDWGVNDDS